MRSTRRVLVIVLVVTGLVLAAGCAGLGDDPGGDANGDDGSDANQSTDDGAGDDDSGGESWPSPPDDVEVEYLENTTGTFLTADGNVTVTLEVAATDPEQRTGLSNRGSLPDDHGMVFVYDEPDDRTFVMRDTYIPLDIIFLDEDRRVLTVEEADPEPGTPNHDLIRYSSDEHAQYVIELEQGYAAEHGIEPGTEIVFEDELRQHQGIVDGDE